MDEMIQHSPCFSYCVADQILVCGGDWTILALSADFTRQIRSAAKKNLAVIDAESIVCLDSAGAQLLIELAASCPQAQLKLSPNAANLLTLIKSYAVPPRVPNRRKANWLIKLGKQCVQAAAEFLKYLIFLGEISACLGLWLTKPKRILWRNIAQSIESCGFYGLGIIGLLSFLVGVVLAYQMGDQLKNYGANIFVVNLLGISILREFAPLITAIIVSGRTASAFTAELGTMKINEELNALITMGVRPIEYLVLPKMIGLMIALPLLSMWAAFMGLLGGMIMAKIILGVTAHTFISQFQTAVAIKQLWIGLMKAPCFALIIGSIGCFQGLTVTGGAGSVGQKTTRSVVQSLFLIIVADAFFSILLSIFHA